MRVCLPIYPCILTFPSHFPTNPIFWKAPGSPHALNVIFQVKIIRHEPMPIYRTSAVASDRRHFFIFMHYDVVLHDDLLSFSSFEDGGLILLLNQNSRFVRQRRSQFQRKCVTSQTLTLAHSHSLSPISLRNSDIFFFKSGTSFTIVFQICSTCIVSYPCAIIFLSPII